MCRSTLFFIFLVYLVAQYYINLNMLSLLHLFPLYSDVIITRWSYDVSNLLLSYKFDQLSHSNGLSIAINSDDGIKISR